MGQIVLILLGLVISLVGIILVYDARPVTAKFFSFGDQNEASLGLKMIGFAITIIGALIVYFNI